MSSKYNEITYGSGLRGIRALHNTKALRLNGSVIRFNADGTQNRTVQDLNTLYGNAG